MKKTNNTLKKALSLLVAIAVFLGTLPTFGMVASAAAGSVGTRASDPSTMDGWKDFFGDPSNTNGNISTENAGSVWSDKSVFTNTNAFDSQISMADANNNFLVALSTMASNSTVTGHSTVPTDTMFVLDVSGSMSDSSVDDDLVDAANESIATLLSTNKYNRVGVVIYSGSSNSNTNNNASVVLLPLGRYTTASDGIYLSYDDGGWFSSSEIGVDSNVVYEGTNRKPTNTSKAFDGATYIQKGIISAMNQFIDEDNETTVTDSVLGTLNRMPVMVLMSDGAATLASNNFTSPGQYTFNSGGYSTEGEAFVTQLSAAYAKNQIEKKYGSKSYFYTLGLAVGNNSLASSVLDPENSDSDVDAYWSLYNQASQSITVESNTVTKISEQLSQNYVDRYFSAGNNSSDLATELKEAFQSIVGEINLQSVYHPTLVEGNANLSGYISFVDRIGKYMQVEDIKGILINNVLHTGELLSKNFVAGGGDLGTSSNPKPLGAELVHSVQQRLGIDSVENAQQLIRQAYQTGQLSYDTVTGEFSNYIGWYANAKGEYLGFYHEGETVLPSATGNAATDPVFTVKSYGYLGETDEIHGVHDSDMMYATVQVRENIKTGEQIVTFAIPAALIPTITYNIELDENDALDSVGYDENSAKHPIRLVYEVGLDENINSLLLADPDPELAEYIKNNTENGKVNFYTNQYQLDNKTGYGTVNTYSYFRPSRQNEKYYYLENALVYANNNGTLYNGTAAPTGTKYRKYTVYEKNGAAYNTKTVYRQLSEAALATAVDPENDGTWVIPSGNIHVNLDGYTIFKTPDETNTLVDDNGNGIANLPFVDVNGHNVNDTDYDFVVGATLGNNGKISVTPETGIKITKTVTETADGASDTFTFTVKSTADATKEFATVKVAANGTETGDTVEFNADGEATVTLKDGETVYILGLTANNVYTVTENENKGYAVASVNGDSTKKSADLTAMAGKIVAADFVNTPVSTGNLTIYKTVTHDMGAGFTYSANTTFAIETQLSGANYVDKAYEVKHSGNPGLTSITPENGKFTIYLKNNEQFEILGLPDGTTANGTEVYYDGTTRYEYNQSNWYTGFTEPTYWDSDVNPNNGIVVITANTTATAGVINKYEPDEIEVNLDLSGVKTVDSSWPTGEVFTFELQEPDGDGWKTVKTATVKEDTVDHKYSITHALTFDKVGEYSYQVVEKAGNNENVIYDQTKHNFTVVVTDADFDGKLEAKVVSAHTGAEFDSNGNTFTNDHINFTNYYDKEPAIAYLDIQKILDNKVGNPSVTEHGFEFTLYDEAKQTEIAKTSGHTDSMGEAQLVWTVLEDANTQAESEKDYKYILSENKTYMGNELEGMSYSKDIEITVTVTKNGVVSTKIKSAVLLDGNNTNALAANGEVEVKNEYKLDPAKVTFDVEKKLVGRDFAADDEFEFELKQIRLSESPEAVLSTNNTKTVSTNSSTVDFGEISLPKVGTYYFEVREIAGDTNIGITYDHTVYYASVTVTDDLSGALAHNIEVYTLPDEKMVFTNTYKAEPDSLQIKAEKQLTGRAIRAGEFAFTLTLVEENGTPVTDAAALYASADADGNIVFEEITYTNAGTYKYELAEVVGTLGGVTYDTDVENITVTVTDDGNGQLGAVSNKSASQLVFNNTYTASTKLVLDGQKYLLGRTLNVGDFTFELSDGVNQPISKTNAADGTFSFELDYTEADIGETFNYTVKEVKGGTYELFENGGDHYGINYDHRVYKISVTVTDNLNGTLNANAVITNAETNTPSEKLVFVNRSTDIAVKEVSDEATPEINVDGKSVSVGDILDYSISYYCGAGSNDVTITDTIPDGTKYVDGSATEGGIYSEGKITWSFNNVTAGETKTVTFKVEVTDGGKDITNKAVVIDGNNTYETNETENFTYEKTASKTEAVLGEEVGYSIVYRNNTGAEMQVTITDTLDERLEYLEGTATKNGVYNNGVLTWTLTVPAGETVTVTFSARIKADAQGSVENTVVILENNVEYKTNTVTTEVLVPDYKVTKTQSVNGKKSTDKTVSAEIGDKITYSITLENTGDVALNDISIVDTVPKGLIVNPQADVNNDGMLQDGVITWNIQTLEIGEKITVSFTATVPEVEEAAVYKNVAVALYDKDGDGEDDPEESNGVEVEVDEPEKEPEKTPEKENNSDKKSPQTGDRTNFTMWLALLFVSSMGLSGVYLHSRKRKN